MRRRLTKAVVMQKAPASGTIEITDTLLPGWSVRIGKSKRAYSVRRRIGNADPVVRRPLRLAVATTPEKKAREAAAALLDKMAAGTDPEDAEREEQREAQKARDDTFASVAASYMAEHGAKLKSGAELQRKLDVDINPLIGALPIADVRRDDIKDVLRRKAATSPVSANRLLALIRAVLRYAEDESKIDTVPSFRKLAEDEAPRERALSRVEIRTFWHGLEDATVEPQLRHALKLALTTGQRRAEVLFARWDEMDFETGWWEIPGSRTKNGRTHRVPLSATALKLLDNMAVMTADKDSDFIFANGGGQPFSPYSLSQAMRKSLDVMKLADSPATVHDLRRTMATQLGELGVGRFVIGKLLNHSDQGITGRVYDKHEYAGEKAAAMAAWSDRLREIVEGRRPAGNVVDMPRRAG